MKKILFTAIFFIVLNQIKAQNIPVVAISEANTEYVKKLPLKGLGLSKELYKTTDSIEELKRNRETIRQKLSKKLQIVFEENPLEYYDANSHLSFYFLVNSQNQIDSIYYGIFKMEVTQDSLSKRMMGRDVLKNKDLNSNDVFLIEKNLSKIIKNLNLKNNENSDYVLQAFVSLYNIKPVKSNEAISTLLKEKLDKLPDTTSKIVINDLGLSNFPKELYRFRDAKTIDLSNNRIKKLDIDIRKFPKLQAIILNKNYLNEKSIRFRKNNQIKYLNLSNNHFAVFPKRIYKNKMLEDLFISNAIIENFDPAKPKKYKNLKNLNLYNNEIDRISTKIKYFNKLEVLDLYHNNLKELPNEICDLSLLQTLAVSNNQLWKLPDNFWKMESLNMVYAHHNRLNTLPDLPKKLAFLDLGYNLFTEVPFVLKNNDSITEIDFSNNLLTLSPEIFLTINNLKKLFITNNEFKADARKFSDFEQIIVDLKKKSVEVK